MERNKYADKIPLLISLYELGRIGKDAFSLRIQKVPFQDLLILCDLLGEDALEKTIHAAGISFEDENENNPVSSIDIVKNTLRMHNTVDHLNELIIFAEESVYQDTKRFLFSLFSRGIRDLSLIEKCSMVEKIHETAGIYHLADSIGMSIRTSSLEECLEALGSMKKIPDEVEEKFFSRILLELRTISIENLQRIVKKTSGRLCDAALNEAIFRRKSITSDELIVFLNESLKRGHASQEALLREELYGRFESFSIPIVFEKMKKVRDRELIQLIMFNILNKKREELMAYLLKEKEEKNPLY